MYLRMLVGVMLLSLVGCASTIGNRNDLKTTEFKLNQTKKSEVADYLGLPAKIRKNDEKTRQYWYYTKGAKLSSLIVPLAATGTTTTIGITREASDLDFDAMFVFDENDTLIEISK